MSLWERISEAPGPSARTFRFLAPLALAVLYFLSIPLIFGARAGEFTTLVGAYSLPPLGKESVIPLAVARGFNPLLVASYLVVSDMIGALFLAWNWDLVLRIPLLGGLLEELMERARSWMAENVRRKEATFTGLVLFMAIPFQGSGSLMTTAAGRTLGMRPERVLYAIFLGSFLSAFGIALAVSGLASVFRYNLLLGLVVLGTGFVAAHYIYHYR